MNFTRAQQEGFIRMAMAEADKAVRSGHSPFGVVLVNRQGAVVLAAHNTARPDDILAHAELNLIRSAAKNLGLKRLDEYAVFINAASCAMCAAALIRAGVCDVYYGAPQESHTNPAATFEQLAPFSREPLRITGGILADECRAQIQQARKGTA